jgi:hypothetical protein
LHENAARDFKVQAELKEELKLAKASLGEKVQMREAEANARPIYSKVCIIFFLVVFIATQKFSVSNLSGYAALNEFQAEANARPIHSKVRINA